MKALVTDQEVRATSGRVLRERTPVEDFEVEGTVVKVNRPGDELFGDAVVLGAVDGRTRQIHIKRLRRSVDGDDAGDGGAHHPAMPRRAGPRGQAIRPAECP